MTSFADILVEVSPGETRAALIARDGTLVELFIERVGARSKVGGVHLARVRKVEKRLRGAFVDIAPGVPGFMDRLSREHEGQAVVVQVVRDAGGGKHALVRPGVVLAGRDMALLPGGTGIAWEGRPPSRREEIERIVATISDATTSDTVARDPAARDPAAPDPATEGSDGGWRLKPGVAALGEEGILRRGAALRRLWAQVQEKARDAEASAVLLPPPDLVRRLLLHRAGSGRILVDDRRTFARIEEMLETEMQELRGSAVFETPAGGLFESAGIEEQIAAALAPVVEVPGGGRLVIESTEALTAIDIDLAAAGGRQPPEQAVLATNLEAAAEVARQVTLRNISGLIVVDFVSMRGRAHRRRLVETQRRAFRDSAVRVDVLGMTAGGLVEITRRRERPSLAEMMTVRHAGAALAPSPESVACRALREVLRAGGPGRRVIQASAEVLAALREPLAEALAETGRRLGEAPELREAPEIADFEILTEPR